MTIRRLFITGAFVFLTGTGAPVVSIVADTDPAEFICILGNQARELIRSDSTPAQKQAFFHQLLQQDFDIPGIARFVFGPHWRVATEPEQQEFIKLFEDYIVRSYSERFAQYRGETLRATGSQSDPEGAIVTSEIVRPEGAPPIKVEWRLSTPDSLYRVSDVIIDGVSMAATQRAEFASLKTG